MKHDIIFMNNKVVNSLVADNMKTVINDIEKCLSLFDSGDVINPGKLVLRWGDSPEDENVHGRINAMPGYVGGEYNMAGIKWIGSGPNNYVKGLPRASVTVILNDPETKLPVAIADGTTVSAKRTGAVGGLAVKYLARKDAGTMLVCGAGAQGRTQLEAALCERPGISQVFIYDLYFDRAEAFAKEMTEKFKISIIPVETPKEACKKSDIVVTVTLANEPFIQYDWLKKGALLMNMADYEVTRECVSKADKVVVDTWDGIKHRLISTVAIMHHEGEFKDEDIHAELGAIINGKKCGRENDNEIIYFNAVGMGIEDICVVTHAYKKALDLGLGTRVNYWE